MQITIRNAFKLIQVNCLIAFSFAILPVQSVQSQTLHAVILSDSLDQSIGKSVKKDMANFKDLVNQIASKTGMDLQLTVLDGKDFTYKKANNAFGKINPGSEDLVFIYFSAHGFRMKETKGKWPLIHFPDDNFVDQNELYKTQVAKKPRLLIIMSDVCNVYADEGEPIPGVIPRSMSANEETNYATLFRYSRGSILASSSIPGQYSQAMDKGGAYSLQFLSNLKSALKSSNTPVWANIMKAANKPLFANTDHRQDPQYQLLSFTEGSKVNTGLPVVVNPPVVNPTPNKRQNYKFSEGYLQENANKKWKLNYDGVNYNLKEYERDKNFISMLDESNEDYYSVDHINKILYHYDWENEEWVVIAEGLK
ncbi:caspase family protein [Leptospira sp. 96542]|nr:caspase family protein [Leptospira sp. 96542]